LSGGASGEDRLDLRRRKVAIEYLDLVELTRSMARFEEIASADRRLV
jgi:hypothetical protein